MPHSELSPWPQASRLPKPRVKMNDRPHFERIPLMTVEHIHNFTNKLSPRIPNEAGSLINANGFSHQL